MAPSPRQQTEKVEAVALEAKRMLWSDYILGSHNKQEENEEKKRDEVFFSFSANKEE